MNSGKPKGASLTHIRHEVSTAVGHIESAYEDLKEEPSSEFAHRMFELGIARLQALIRQLDRETNQGNQSSDTTVHG